ncbi:MAG: ABC transporter permease [Candidatus Freyarchaeum deiterrae]
MKHALAIAKKDIRIYYLKGSVFTFGVLIPLFLFLAFSVGRNIPIGQQISGLLGMTLLFTATAVSPIIMPWEGTRRTLERLVSTPVSLSTIILGDVIASFIFGIIISIVPIAAGLIIGVPIENPIILVVGIILASFCFSCIGELFATPPTNVPSTIMMLSSLIKFPLLFVSGIFVPIQQLPGWGQAVAVFSPLTYFTDLANYVTQGSGYFPVFVDIGMLILFSAIFLLAAIYLHKRTLSSRL